MSAEEVEMATLVLLLAGIYVLALVLSTWRK